MPTFRPNSHSQRGPWPIVLFAVALTVALLAFWLHHLPRPPSVPEVVQKPAPPPCVADPAGLLSPTDANGKPLDYWHTCGTEIVDRNGQPVLIHGIAWSGMELAGGAPGGLDKRSYKEILQQVKDLGYNTVRIPYSSEAIAPGYYATGINPKLNPDLNGLTSLQVLDRIVAECHQLGLKVILDRHRINPYAVPSLWYDNSYSTDQWIDDWVRLAERYRGNDTVIAADLENEPYAATWGTGNPQTDWRAAATRAGDAVLDANPYLLILVQGVGNDPSGKTYWYGGELSAVRQHPMTLNRSGRLVYSPHEYGPSVYRQAWFFTPDFPSNLPGIWNLHWGFIADQGLAPVVIGETGGPDVGYDVGGTWQRVFLSYLEVHRIGFILWAINPDEPDTGGLFEADWRTINFARQSLFSPYLDLPRSG